MTNETPNTKRRRRWFQFSLRTLLIVVTLSAASLGWVGWKLEQGRRQRAVIAWVEQQRGRVGFEDVEEKSWWREWTVRWFGENVQGVFLSRTSVSDLSPLAELKNLEEFHVGMTKVSDLSPLAELENLKILALSITQVSDLSPLAELKNLEVLYLDSTQVSDLSPLAELKNLERLLLNRTQVSDLSPLTELENLKELDLYYTQVSDEQVRKLQEALPNCKITHPSLVEK